MINIKRQIDYWITSSTSDIETADLLIKNGKLLPGLFFCHLVIEKALKAHVVKQTESIPPRSHNLILLADKARLSINEDDGIFLGILMKYQLEGRYPDYKPSVPTKSTVNKYFNRTKEMFKWINEQL